MATHRGTSTPVRHARQPAPVQFGLGLDQSDDYARTRARLLRLAKELLQIDANTADESSPTHGVRFDMVRHAAEHRGWLSGLEGTKDGDPSMSRLLSFGAQIMREAGGVACEYTPSKHANAKGRPVRVYRLASAVRG